MRSLLLLVLFICPVFSIAQNSAPLVALGDASWDQGDWYTAHAYYEKAFLLDTTKFDVTVKYAEALRMVKDFSKAEYYYEKLYKKDKGRKFKEGLFWLAEMQKLSGNYHEALRNFKKFKKKARKDKESYWYKKTIQQIESCTWAINQRIDSSAVNIYELDNMVNTDESEFAPALFEDSVFYFSSMKSFSEASDEALVRVFRSTMDSLANSSQPEEWWFDNYPAHVGNINFYNERNWVFYTKCDSVNRCNIFKSEIIDGNWTNEVELTGINLEDYTSTMPYFANVNGQEVLFFVSNRPGGKGKLDIWWSEYKQEEFQRPINASDKINTPDNEITPFYQSEYLYFSSEWHNGFGGFDIFKSKGVPRSFWEPENLGQPMNSALNDMYYSYSIESDRGFLASNRLQGEELTSNNCCNDIYTFIYPDSLYVDSLEIFNLETLNKYLPVTLYFHNDEPDPNTWNTSTQLSYMDAYQSYKELEETYKKENSRGMSGDKKEEAIFDVEDFYAFFVDKGVQDLELFSKLLLEELQLGTKIELSVRGFASPRAKSDYNVNLTKRRISSMENYLREYQNGIYLPYLNGTSPDGGQLTIVELPFGEYQADQSVSDELTDEQESIYSRGARLERKIEITSVQRILPDSSYAEIKFDKEVFDFGKIDPLSPVDYTFFFENTGTEILYIDSIDTECGCTVPNVTKTTIPPGESSEIHVSFDPKGKSGLVSKTVSIYTNASEEPKVITITAEIE